MTSGLCDNILPMFVVFMVPYKNVVANAVVQAAYYSKTLDFRFSQANHAVYRNWLTENMNLQVSEIPKSS